ncbi:MAG TPA: hypothetical protein DIT13_09780, partial [Verrucomicrobiales bacterium]|nr:hypothetical protein [Verrucomicrobiales bacterium]
MKPPLFQRWCNRFLPGFGSWRKAFRSHLSASSLTTLSADEWRDLLVKECETAQKGSPGDPCSAQIQRTIQNDKWRCLLRAYPEAAIFLHDKGYEHSDSKHKAELVAECTGLLETTGLTSADASAVLVEFLGTRPDCQVRMQVVLVQESPTRAVLAELVLTLVDDAVAGNSSCSFVPSPAMRLWLGWDEELQTLADDFKKSLVEAYIQACELAEWPKSCHIIWSLCFSREHPFSHEHPAAPDLSGKSLQLPAAIGLSLLAARNSSVRWKAGLNRDAIARMEPRSLLATGCFGASTDDLKAKLAKFFEFTSNDRESFHAVLLPEDDNNLLHLGESPGKYERTSHPRTWLCRQTKTIPIVARPGLSELLQAVVVEKMIHVSRGPGFQGRLVTPPLASSSPATAPDPVADWMEAESPRVLVIENDDADQAADALARAASKTGWTVMGYWPDSNTADPLVVVQSLVAQARRATQNSDAVPSGGAFHSDPVERELQMLAHCLDSLPEGSKALMILAGVDFISDHHGRSSLPARLAGIVRRHFNTNSELRLILQSGSYAGVPRTDDVKFLELAKGKAGKGNAWNAAGLCELLLARDDHDDPLGWLVCARRLFRRDKTWRTLLGESEAESLKNAIQNASAVLNVPEEDLWRMSMITRRQIMEQLCETDTGKERVKEWHCRWGRRLFMLLHNEPSPQDAAGDMPAAREARQYRLDHVLGHLRLGRLWDNFHEALQNPGFILEHLAQPRGVRRLAKSLEKALSGKTCLPVDHPARPRVSELAFVIHPLADHVLKIDEALARQCLHNSIVEQKETGLRHWLKLFLAATVRLEQAEQACLDQAGQAWLRLLPTASGTSTLGLLPSHTLRKPAPMVAAAFCPQLTAQGRPQVLTFSSDTVQLWKLGETERSFEANTHWAGASSIRQTPVRMLVPGFINGRYAILVSAYGVSIFDTKNGSCQLNMVKLSFRSLTSVLHGRRLYLSVASTPPQLMVYEVRDTGDVSKPFSFAFVSEWKLSEEKMLGGDHAKKNAGGVTDEDADRDIYRSLAVTLDGSLLAVAKMDGVVDVYNTPDLSLTHQDGVVDDY